MGMVQISAELERSLQNHWVSLQCPSYPNRLFSHEWRKHGTCSGMTRSAYFHKAIKLHLEYDILKTLGDAGIYPDWAYYDLASVQEVLGKVIGADPIITCSWNERERASQVFEVLICLDKEFLLPFECPENPELRTNCRTYDALFPGFDPRHGAVHAAGDNAVSPARLCADPSLRKEGALQLSEDEEQERRDDDLDLGRSRGRGLASGDAALGDAELPCLFGNRTAWRDELDGKHNIFGA